MGISLRCWNGCFSSLYSHYAFMKVGKNTTEKCRSLSGLSDSSLQHRAALPGVPACTLRASVFELSQECKSVPNGEGVCVMGRQSSTEVSVLSINLKGQPGFLQLNCFQERRKVSSRGQHIQRSLAARACVSFPNQPCVNPRGLRVWSSLEWQGSQRTDREAELKSPLLPREN